MAWKEVLPMEERARFVLEVEREEMNFSELCHRYAVSRKTGYKWIKRYRAEGLDGVRDRSSKPLSCPHKTDQKWEIRIITKRLEHPSWGPKKIKELLRREEFDGRVPAASTIGEILRRYGLTGKRKRRHRRTYINGSLTQPKYPNHVWAVDYKGWFRTRDGVRCEPLTISDLYSRYVLEVKALPDQSYDKAREEFEQVFESYGLPKVIRSDNGLPFASRGAGGLSRLNVWWILLGIKPEFITKGHPEENGVHERMHLTLKKESTIPPSTNIGEQQSRFDIWRKEFNEKRPHEAINMKVPAQKYSCSKTVYNRGINNKKQINYPQGYVVRVVKRNGEIKWKGKRRFISTAIKGEKVGIKEIRDGLNQVYFDYVLLGDLYNVDYRGLRTLVGVHDKKEKVEEKV